MTDYCYCDGCTGVVEPPEVCHECWIASTQYKMCDGSCGNLTEADYRRYFDGPNWQGKQLIHKGGKS